MATVQGRVLLGWMPRDQAINFLLNDCHFDPPIDAAAAEAIWNGYRAAVTALPDRAFGVAGALGLSPIEAGHGASLMAFAAANPGMQFIGFRKINLRQLVVRQYTVVTQHAQTYAGQVQDTQWWLRECLPLTQRGGTFNWRHYPLGMNARIECDLPHGEWFFAPVGNGVFAPIEGARHVVMMDGTDRSYLWAGYHRSFARVSTTPIANAPEVVVAVARNVLTPPAVAGAAIPGVTTTVDPFGPFGGKAALFGDFFVDGLYMDVNLRKKRYQLQIEANWVALNDP